MQMSLKKQEIYCAGSQN